MVKNGNQHLFGILQTSPTFKNSENMEKMIVSKNICDGERHFFQINEGYKASCVILLRFWYITRRSVFI